MKERIGFVDRSRAPQHREHWMGEAVREALLRPATSPPDLALSVWWIRLGIRPLRTEPASPERGARFRARNASR